MQQARDESTDFKNNGLPRTTNWISLSEADTEVESVKRGEPATYNECLYSLNTWLFA